MHKMFKYIVIFLLVPGLAASDLAQESANEIDSWDFDVYLDDKKVGKHRFELSETNGFRHIQSDASFKYKFLFVTAYRYEHSAAERWADNCLVEFEANTNTNGENISVSGEQTGKGFVVERDDNSAVLPACVMTFAYWNADFLDQTRLLNPQTGEFIDVRVEEVGNEIREIRGQRILATRFKLTAREVDLTLWYSPTNEWLGLESVAKGGRVIRYELS